MSDIFKGLTGGGLAGLTAWVLPSGFILGLFWLLVYPEMRAHFDRFDHLSATHKLFVWVFAAVFLGVFLQALSTPMYRLLEGYSWPRACRERSVAKQRAKKSRLEGNIGGTGWGKGLQEEQIARFPDFNEVAPTRLGNALRALETYGATRFELDSQVMWSELNAVVPKSLQTELERSRAGMDFFVALFYLSAACGLVTIGVAFDGRIKPLLLLIALVAFLSTIVWYEMAVISTSYYANTVQALVNLGRVKLANEMGLKMPGRIDQERRMWWLVKSLIYYNDPNSLEELNLYRQRPPVLSPTTPEAGNRAEPAPESQEGEEPDEAEVDQ